MSRLAFTLVLAGLSGVMGGGDSARAAEPARLLKVGQFNPNHETVEMFTAMADGSIDVKLIHRNSQQGRVMIENLTDRPLNIKLPEAFAGVHVLAQNVGGGFAGGVAQGTGGAFGGGGAGGGAGGGGGGAGGGFFNVAAEQVGELVVTSLCLEHGKSEPRPPMTYQVRPIGSFTQVKAVHHLVRLLGEGQLNQRSAQAAAWHLNNNMSWDELAAKEIRRATGHRYPYFTTEELALAQQISQHCEELAAQDDAPQATPIDRVSTR